MTNYGPYKNIRVANDAEAAEIRARPDEYLDARKPFYIVADSPRPSGTRLVFLGHRETRAAAEQMVAHRVGKVRSLLAAEQGVGNE